MISLSASHLSEISCVPELLAMVDNGAVRSADNFTQSCAIHNCFESFMHMLPHSSFSQNPLTLLARLDQWNIVQQMDWAQFSLNDWRKAIRRAAKSGHIQFVDQVLQTPNDTTALLFSVVVGASMNDQLEVLQRFLPQVSDQEFVGHVAVTAAQHGSINCVRYCMNQITPQQWLGTLSACINLHRCETKIADMLLDNSPVDYPITPLWCTKFAKRLAHNSMDGRENMWRLLCKHMEAKDLAKITAHWSSEHKQRLRDIQQNVMLGEIVTSPPDDVVVPKRKM